MFDLKLLANNICKQRTDRYSFAACAFLFALSQSTKSAGHRPTEGTAFYLVASFQTKMVSAAVELFLARHSTGNISQMTSNVAPPLLKRVSKMKMCRLEQDFSTVFPPTIETS